MNSLILASIRLMRAVHHAYQDPEFRALLAMMIVLLISGTSFYAIHEGWSIVDALYFCVTTMSTVGFGDLSPTTNISKIFTIMYSLVSIGVFVGVASKLANAMISRSRHLTGE